MHTYYKDILNRIPDPPQWWDEYAVPRFCDFSPDEVANIYARYVALVLITCQDCGTEFQVAFSQSHMDTFGGWNDKGEERWVQTLDLQVQSKNLHYGDPPNNDCCCAGPTMNSEPRRVLEFWQRLGSSEWDRVPDLEINIEPSWVTGPV